MKKPTKQELHDQMKNTLNHIQRLNGNDIVERLSSFANDGITLFTVWKKWVAFRVLSFGIWDVSIMPYYEDGELGININWINESPIERQIKETAVTLAVYGPFTSEENGPEWKELSSEFSEWLKR